LMRSRANGWAVVPGDVDDRHRNVRFFKTVPHLDTRNIAQVDVEKDANHPVEIAVICEGFSRGKQHAFVAQLPQQSRYAPQHHGVVIDDKNKVSLWQAGPLDVENLSWVKCKTPSVGGSRTLALIHVKRGGNGRKHLGLPVSGCPARFLDLLLDLPEPVGGTPSTAICSGLPVHRRPAHPFAMGTKSHETI
jgi:hypothetical protein